MTEHSPGYQPPRPANGNLTALAQVHCHQHAVLGWHADALLLDEAGVQAEQLDAGCCGLAGNFGFERGHREISEACAERVMLPKIRAAKDDTVILADGFSCRTQIHEFDSAGKKAVHLAELLAAMLDARLPASPLERGHPEN